VWVQSNERISLASIVHPKNPNTMWVDSKVADLELGLMSEVLVDVVEQLVMLCDGELPLRDCNRTVFMRLGRPTTDVHHLASSAMTTAILDEHGKRHKRLRIDYKVCHDGLEAWERRGRRSGRVQHDSFF
jgi:hypothetical protein